MSTLSKGAQVALLKWVNTFEGLDRKAETLDDLTDGVILAQVLHILNPDFQSSSLNQNATSWLEKKRNLETVYRALAQFLRQENPYLAPSPNHFRSIIDNPDADGMCEFLSAFVSAACLGDLAKTYVPAIMKMERTDQREIMAIIQKKQVHIKDAEARAQANGNVDTTTRNDALDDYMVGPAPRDPDLAQEAELARLSKELDTLRKQNADLLTRNEQLQMSREEVVQDLQIAQRERDVLRKTNETDASAIIRKLEAEKREEEHLIDTLQAQAEDDRIEKLKLRNELEVYKAKAEKAEGLSDQVKELLHERDTLSSKLKQAEWYKKSAEEAKITEQRNRELETQNHELREQVQEFDKMRADNEALKYTCQQYRKQMETYEREKFDDQSIKINLKEENESIKLERQILQDQLRVSEEQIKDLQERLQVSGSSVPASPGASAVLSNLEQELQTTSDPAARYRLEISRLEAENKLLRNNMGVAAENERLRTDLDMEKKRENLLTLKYNEVYEKYVVAQEQIKALLNQGTGKGDEAFNTMQKDYLSNATELERAQTQLQKLKAEVADKDRELMTVRTDLNAVGQESIDALEVLKSSDQLVSASLMTELEATRKQLEEKRIDYEQVQQQLMDALLSKDKIRQQLDEARAAGLPLSTSPTPAPEQSAADQKTKKEDAEKTEKLKTALKTKIQQLEKSEQEKYELQRRLKAAESGGAYAAQKAALEAIIKNLERENALISSAWYDLTSRLQSNHVVLQRRHDVPKSWLNKQRHLVNERNSNTT
ncbi:Protein hook [Coniochaeta hoffmannii]|uniref:Protein hook n=1 Tax=Coniochaeta hoffmannii TaxID=91930 RepID=A0AA38RQ68_9PEZI|nr:Protein hook [Coniochaeta hoffmannii]